MIYSSRYWTLALVTEEAGELFTFVFYNSVNMDLRLQKSKQWEEQAQNRFTNNDSVIPQKSKYHPLLWSFSLQFQLRWLDMATLCCLIPFVCCYVLF